MSLKSEVIRRLPLPEPESSWSLDPGDTIHRSALRKLYGAPRQGALVLAKHGGDLLLFVDRRDDSGRAALAGWVDDACFHFPADLQHRHQKMTEGNRSLAEHRDAGRALRVFQGSTGIVRYVGAFEVDAADPWHAGELPGAEGDGRGRRVLVFHLRPVGPVINDSSDRVVGERPPVAESAPPPPPQPAPPAPPAIADPLRDPQEAERRKRGLVLKYAAAMKAKGYAIDRTWCTVEGEATPIIPDVVDQTRRNLVEGAGTTTRESVRMLIGRLADFGRFHPDHTSVALLPERPRTDLEQLLATQGISVVWITPEGVFEDNADGSCS
jgi:hypothetical protein